MDRSEVELIQSTLKAAQAKGHYSLRGFARRLGISHGQLSMVLSGKRQPGLRFWLAAVENVPEIRELLAEYLQTFEGDDEGQWL